MFQNFFASINVINILLEIFTWILIVFLAIRFYKKLREKPRVWKVLLVLIIGLFSFSVNINGLGTILKLPILPLGVWILFLIFLKKTNWRIYRPFAWLGFFANFIFLSMTIVEIPIQHFIYPQDEPSTYLANVKDASMVMTHPSGKKSLLDKESLIKQLPNMREEDFYSNQWYNETYMNNNSKNSKERFPYQLIGAKPKWGSGLSSVIYIEKNGKGILIATAKKQHYFHFKDSIMKREGE